MVFYRLEPFGQIRDDLNAGIIASTMANCWLKRAEPFQAHEFMPKFGLEQEQKKEEDGEEQSSDGWVTTDQDMLQMIDDIMERQARRKALEAKVQERANAR
jgi:hypothetical protein